MIIMSGSKLSLIEKSIRTVPDFPIEGITFRDITPVLAEPGLLSIITDLFVSNLKELDWIPDVIVGPEARGFIFGPLLAERLQKAFIPIRKPNKLPHKTIKVEYSLEYGTNILEIHEDALKPGQKAIIVDDLIATGGTISACAELCQKLGAEILGSIFLIELIGLDARKNLSPIPVHSLLQYPA